MPIGELINILSVARVQNLHSPPIECNYSHVKIEPFWQDQQVLVFKAHLPLTGQYEYIRYRFRSWPVRNISSPFSTQLQVRDDVAFHTSSGGMFIPTGFIGQRPAICRTGPIFNRSRTQCSRGIITGERELRQSCKITITSDANARTMVHEILPGMVAVSTTGESPSLLCIGHAERRLRMAGGVFIGDVPVGCRLNSVGFAVPGLTRRTIELAIKTTAIRIKPFHLHTTVTTDAVARHLKGPQ